MLTYELEKEYSDRGYSVICGVDEAGRGPLAGDVYAGAVILPQGLVIEGLNDSKKLTEKKREKLFDVITSSAISWGVGKATNEEIDEINILNAALLAMRRAIEQLSPQPDFVLVDGNVEKGFVQPCKAIVKGDATSPSIAAASILAKVSRDRSCIELDRLYPEYGFAKHKGYPTKEHYEAILKYGVLPVHRRSFRLFR
ncbi:MAG: ribonuclease HII [Firmicutes bacterium]|nr:ribonuclease HII [Candidatus Colimorpha enterica]